MAVSDPMLHHSASRQRVLEELLQAPQPMRVEELARGLGISRNATYQHITGLERDGMIERAMLTQGRGRPGQTYQLTDTGRAAFPKHYALIAGLLIEQIGTKFGKEALEQCFKELGLRLANVHLPEVAGAGEWPDRLSAIAQKMEALGYRAATQPDHPGEIRAHNCVFHELARKHPEVCAMDLALLERLAGRPVTHAECMVRGGTCCRFTFTDADPKEPSKP